jgi:hypothetical protein
VIGTLQSLNHWVRLGGGDRSTNPRAMAIAAAVGVESQYKTIQEVRDRMRELLAGYEWFEEVNVSRPPAIDGQQWLLDVIQQLEDAVEAGRGDDRLSPKSSELEALYRMKYLRRTVKLVGTAVGHLRSIARQKGWL